MKKRVLVIPDLHIPFEHSRGLSFCKALYKRFNCNKVICTGDILDHHRISRHTSEPDSWGAVTELEKAKKNLKAWVRAFPKMDICYSNHDLIPKRQAKELGVPSAFLKDLNEVYGLPKTWVFHEKDIIVDNVLYRHIVGSGKFAAINKAKEKAMSVVGAHTHKHGGVIYYTTPQLLRFGMNVGCLIDKTTYAMRYSDSDICLGAGIVLEGREAFFIPMAMGKDYKNYKNNKISLK